MKDAQLHALRSIQFNSVVGPDEIWSPLTHHVDGLHPRATDAITQAVEAAKRRPTSTPTGFVLNGERGVGKTHMLGWLRRHVQEQGGWFFMPKLIDGPSFWPGAVYGFMSRLLGSDYGQLGPMLNGLAELAGCDRELRMRLHGNIELDRSHLDEFLDRLESVDDQVARDCQDTLRALVLYQSNRRRLQNIGDSFLSLDEGLEESARAEWGFRRRNRSPQLVFNDLSRIFALTGPVVLAIDQVDGVLSESAERDEDLLASRVADGLMRMREETVRTIVVIACIAESWERIASRGVNSAADRFKVLELSTRMPSSSMAMAIVEQHLGSVYGEIGFMPPHPTWPVLPSAFDDPAVPNYTPRRLLQRVEEHVRRCLDRDVVEELASFTEAPVETVPVPAAPTDLDDLDARFARLRSEADVVGPLDHNHEDGRMFTLLNAALRAYVLEQGKGAQAWTIDPQSMVLPALHARLKRTLNEAREDEEHWSFRAIAQPNANATLARLRAACLGADIKAGSVKRHLVVLRNMPFSEGTKTKETLAELDAANGVALPIEQDDLRTFSALHAMLGDSPPGFQGWLADRRPASASVLLGTVLGGGSSEVDSPVDIPEPAKESEVDGRQSIAGTISMDPVEDEDLIVLGRNVETGKGFGVPLVQLRKHTAVFAGSGSGKTVLLRRLVEEAALHGVSSILIDSNNDLARLGDRWPSPPGIWGTGDAEKAERYFADTDVVIWTPRRESGRPIALNPLPDFSGVLDDPDEFRTSVDACVAGLLPRTGLRGGKVATGKAVLTQALTYFAKRAGAGLDDFVELLSDLPDGVSTIKNATKLGEAIAEELKAAMINDPVFGGAGERLDPGVLLTPVEGKRARVSVISCVGLPNTDQRQTFVNQLQLALFAWIKRHPAVDRPLGGLLVLDEAQTFVPSRGTTASTESTLTLAAQARKYGLGMVYATQAPKGLHNVATGNAATQFFGHLNSPVHIQAAKELARAKGGQVDDISRLKTGRFYAAAEGAGFAKIQAPLCLSHHPDGPLTEEEVLQRARR